MSVSQTEGGTWKIMIHEQYITKNMQMMQSQNSENDSV